MPIMVIVVIILVGRLRSSCLFVQTKIFTTFTIATIAETTAPNSDSWTPSLALINHSGSTKGSKVKR